MFLNSNKGYITVVLGIIGFGILSTWMLNIDDPVAIYGVGMWLFTLGLGVGLLTKLPNGSVLVRPHFVDEEWDGTTLKYRYHHWRLHYSSIIIMIITIIMALIIAGTPSQLMNSTRGEGNPVPLIFLGITIIGLIYFLISESKVVYVEATAQSFKVRVFRKLFGPEKLLFSAHSDEPNYEAVDVPLKVYDTIKVHNMEVTEGDGYHRYYATKALPGQNAFAWDIPPMRHNHRYDIARALVPNFDEFCKSSRNGSEHAAQ